MSAYQEPTDFVLAPRGFFTIPIHASEEVERDLNAFVRAHRVVSVDRRWVEQGTSSFWSLCVEYLDGSAPAPAMRPQGSRNRIDYREVLKPEEFAVFARLRDLRKQIAQQESVPVYTIFTNEQLAQMVQTRAASRADLEKIAGVGAARLEKYGDRLLELLSAAWHNHDETSQPPV